jgi:hypothetical protein
VHRLYKLHAFTGIRAMQMQQVDFDLTDFGLPRTQITDQAFDTCFDRGRQYLPIDQFRFEVGSPAQILRRLICAFWIGQPAAGSVEILETFPAEAARESRSR